MLSDFNQFYSSRGMNDDPANIYQSLCETVEKPKEEGATSLREVSVPNMVRCPFYEEPVDQRPQTAKYVKRTQRHRSTAQSRLGDMTVGDIRYCFQQLRNAGKNLSPEMMLYNGQSAGEFALKYLRETSTATRKRRKKLARVVSNTPEDGGEGKEEDGVVEQANGSNTGVAKINHQSLNVLEF